MLRVVEKGVLGSHDGSCILDTMEYPVSFDFMVILQLYQQVHEVHHAVSPSLLDQLARSLDTAAVALLQTLRSAGVGTQVLLELQTRGFYAMLNAFHKG